MVHIKFGSSPSCYRRHSLFGKRNTCINYISVLNIFLCLFISSVIIIHLSKRQRIISNLFILNFSRGYFRIGCKPPHKGVNQFCGYRRFVCWCLVCAQPHKPSAGINNICHHNHIISIKILLASRYKPVLIKGICSYHFTRWVNYFKRSMTISISNSI